MMKRTTYRSGSRIRENSVGRGALNSHEFSYGKRVALFLLLGIAGCAGSNSQVTRVQQEKEKLIATIGSQQKLLQDLRSKNEELALRLDDAEKEIARGPGSAGLRRFAAKDAPKELTKPAAEIATKPAAPATSPPAKTSTEPSKVENTKLSWKPFREAAGDPKLGELAKKYPWLKHDAEIGALTVNAPLSFEKDGTTLTGESKLALDELSKVLKDGQGKELRVLVAGQAAGSGVSAVKDGDKSYANARHLGTARALEVADYLDRHGIPSDRLGVAATAVDRKSSADPAAPSLTIHLLPKEVPLVGWGGTETIKR